ncbi:MAG: hypothetical protein ACJ763_19245 [Bdellovibrionia bacterium]
MRKLAFLAFTGWLLCFSASYVQADSVSDALRAEWAGVQSQLIGAIADSDQIDAAYLAFKNWNLRAAPYGELNGNVITGKTELAQAWALAVKISGNLCKARDASQIATLQAWVAWPVNKPEVLSAPGFDPMLARSALEHCARFELEFESSLELRTPDAGTAAFTVVGKSPLTTLLDSQGRIKIMGDVTLNYSKLAMPQSECRVTATGNSGQLMLQTAGIEFTPLVVPGIAPRKSSHSKPFSVKISMSLTAPPTENLMITCPDAGEIAQSVMMWSSGFSACHAGAELHSGQWTFPTSFDVFAEYRGEFAPLPEIHEDLTLRLKHIPN